MTAATLHCSVESCTKSAKSCGLCPTHYSRFRKHGDPLIQGSRKCSPKGAPASERFWSKVTQAGDCWQWTGALTSGGYGNFWSDAGNQPAHRWSYEAMVGEIPVGLDLNHLCRNRACVNPWHLEPVTRKVNSLRGMSPFILIHLARRRAA